MLDAIASIGGSLLGGIFGNSSKKKAIAAQERMNAQNIALQREFAQNGIQWKAADAKAAGLHPLAALGAQTSSFSPISIDGSAYASNPMGEALASAGQDLGRAIHSTRTAGQKQDAYTKTVQDLSIQRMGLENQLLSSQIAKVNQPAVQAAMPSAEQRWLVDGQGQTALPATPTGPVERRNLGPLVNDVPLERTASDPNRPFSEPGAITDIGYGRTSSGYAPVPSADMKQRIEDDFFSETSWNLRNRILPMVGSNYNPPFKAPEGKYWLFNPAKQEYQLYDKRDNALRDAGNYLWNNVKQYGKRR